MISGTRAIEVRVGAVARDEAVPSASASTLAELDALETESEAVEVEAAQTTTFGPALDAKLTSSEREQLVQGANSGRRAVRVEFAPSPQKAEAGLNITTLRERLATVGEIVRVLPTATAPSEAAPGGLLFAIIMLTSGSDAEVAKVSEVPLADLHELLSARALPAPTAPASGAGAAGAPSESTGEHQPADVEAHRPGVLRVDVARIDDTIERLAGLIVTRSRLLRAADTLRVAGADTRELEAIIVDNGRQLRDLRAAVLRVRMVPIAAVLDRLPLVIRGLGRTAGKLVRLTVVGGGAELDKTVAERIFPALVHLLRNAVDHGIETPAERRHAGKDEHATITVTASTRNNRQIEIHVEDDGRGVDRARVAAKAGKEILADDANLLDLLCRPGLSTRDEVNTTSGRGVGMEIVRKVVVDGLGGELELETVAGAGTTFIIRVPVTIAIVDSFTLRCGSERFVVPVPVVEEIVELDATAIVRGPGGEGVEGRFFARRGEMVALLDLTRILGFADAQTENNFAGRQALVVRRGREEPVAFAIDRVLGQQETVIRPLVDPLVAVAGVSGSTDLGDGRATLVLDLLALSTTLRRSSGEERAA
jgi:two-component system chemotaxis sensor kinase CheA